MTVIPERLAQYLEKSTVSFSLADMGESDMPLVLVNESFSRLTGYPTSAAIGRNCRFLQSVGMANAVRVRMREFFGSAQTLEAHFVVPNVRLNGDPFANLIYMSKLNGPAGQKLVLGSQFDVSHRASEPLTLYDRAMRDDVTRFGDLSRADGWQFMGTYDALANSAALVAQHFMEN